MLNSKIRKLLFYLSVTYMSKLVRKILAMAYALKMAQNLLKTEIGAVHKGRPQKF